MKSAHDGAASAIGWSGNRVKFQNDMLLFFFLHINVPKKVFPQTEVRNLKIKPHQQNYRPPKKKPHSRPMVLLKIFPVYLVKNGLSISIYEI